VPTVSTAFMPCSTPLKYCACKPGCAAVVKTSSCVYARGHHPANYYPDFVFRSTIVEIKTNASLRKNLKLERIKLRVGRFYAKEHGLKFRVITETWLNARGF
jgi:hypothetical protein